MLDKTVHTTMDLAYSQLNKDILLEKNVFLCANPYQPLTDYFQEMILVGFDTTKQYCISSGYVRAATISMQIAEVTVAGVTAGTAQIAFIPDKSTLIPTNGFYSINFGGGKLVYWKPKDVTLLYEAISLPTDRYNQARINPRCLLENSFKFRDLIQPIGFVDIDKLRNKSVTPIKTTFLEKTGLNLFNYQDPEVLSNYYLNSSGVPVQLSTVNCYVTGFIPVIPSQILRINALTMGGAYNCFYSYDKSFISSATVNTTITIPSNCYYTRICFSLATGVALSAGNVMINSGSVVLPYEAYNDLWKIKSEYNSVANIATKQVLESNLADSVVSLFNKPKIIIASTKYAVVGDTLQIYYKSIVTSLDGYFLTISCDKGKNYPKYYEYTPTVSDIGSTTMTLSIITIDGLVIDSKTVTLITKSAVNPSTQKNIILVGDSTMMSGQIPIELSRRFKGTTGVATTPTSLALSNFKLVGRVTNSDKSVGWEGTGGWSWSTYLSSGSTSVRFQITGASNINIGDIYRMVYNSPSYYQFQIQEINVTEGVGNIRVGFYTTPYDSNFTNLVPQSGVLTLNSGLGQSSISYSSYTVETYQPFWNNSTNQFDLVSYVNTYCSGSLDYIIVKLGINDIIGMEMNASYSAILNYARTLIRNIHSSYPSCKIIVDSGTLVSQNGGLAASYIAGSVAGKNKEIGFNLKSWLLFLNYQSMCSESEFASYVIFLDTNSEFDATTNYPTSTKALNTRSSTLENIDTNGVHPSNQGYWQIADTYFRALICLI